MHVFFHIENIYLDIETTLIYNGENLMLGMGQVAMEERHEVRS